MTTATQTPYPIPSGIACAEQEIKRSRFIAHIGHAPNSESAMAFIQHIRDTYPDARHHCWAFIAGDPTTTMERGMSDDGEPHGTAGKPMINLLQHQGIGEIVAVVTRYFGGIKLGTGGLVRAYSSTLAMALKNVTLIQKVALVQMCVLIPFDREHIVRHILEKWEVESIEVSYSNDVTLTFLTPSKDEDDLRSEIINTTRGAAVIESKNVVDVE